jgi:hypothetical protein
MNENNRIEKLEKENEQLKKELEKLKYKNEATILEKWDGCFSNVMNEYKDMDLEMFKNVIVCSRGAGVTWMKDLHKIHIFNMIMWAVHEYIDPTYTYKFGEESYFIILNQHKQYVIEYSMRCKTLPDHFYFSTSKNAEDAKNILCNFFGINILDWWYNISGVFEEEFQDFMKEEE